MREHTPNRRQFLQLSIAGSLAALSASRGLAQEPTAAKPNILVFLVDDMGWQDTSVPFWKEPTPFNRHYRTPNMERLAKQGIVFTDAHAHPVCSPTRTSIMTGWNPARHHVTNWTLHPDKDTSGDWGPLAAPKEWRMGGLQPGDITLPSLLQKAGYHTIHCGKAHWGAKGTPGEDPTHLGFDVNIAGHAAGAPGSYQGLDDFDKRGKGEEPTPWAVPGLDEYFGKDVHLTDVLTQKAEEALDNAVQAGKPFYLYMAHYAVHTPIQPHKRFMAGYEDRNYVGTDIDIPDVEERYASMVEGMDASLGALLDKLDKLGVAQDTLVIFTSDNGGLSAHARGTTPRGTELNTHNWPVKAGKGSAYEGGTHVPFIAAWARRDDTNAIQHALPIAHQSTSAQPIVSEDLFPTIIGIAGAANLIAAGYPLDGRDIREYIVQRASDPERPLYFHYPHVWGPHGPGYEPHSAMRVGDWKVIYFYIPRRWELYNIKDDIGETKDLAAEQPERLGELAETLKRDLIAMGAQWPTRRDTGEEEPMRTPAELAAMKPLLDFEAPDADQGVAVDAAFVYAIDNTVVAKHDKFTGALVKRWTSVPECPLIHMNSGIVRDGRLYCAHSNYPNLPMTSSVEIWDTGTLEHIESHDFGVTDGSLTWMDWHDGHWWGCFAHYAGKGGDPDKDPSHTTLVKFDAEWQRLDSWKFPPEVIERTTPHSCSGGSWGPDGLLYVSGHDRPELYALRLPQSGVTLECVGTVPFPNEGQAIAFDRTGTGLLYGIIRGTSHIVARPFASIGQ